MSPIFFSDEEAQTGNTVWCQKWDTNGTHAFVHVANVFSEPRFGKDIYRPWFHVYMKFLSKLDQQLHLRDDVVADPAGEGRVMPTALGWGLSFEPSGSSGGPPCDTGQVDRLLGSVG